MHKYLTFVLLTLLPSIGQAQLLHGRFLENYRIKVDTISENSFPILFRDTITEQIAGFPLGFMANPTYKNVRNIALANLDESPEQELIFAANTSLYAYKNTTQLWQKSLIGTATYPPAIADIDGDGDLEIAQPTGGPPNPGRIYLLDHEGNELEGWPLNFSNNWIITGAAMSDVDNDGLMEIIFNERIGSAGRVHVVRIDGTSFNENWPVTLDRTPSLTPSIGDIDNDGEREIVCASTGSLYVLQQDGSPEAGWPVGNYPTQRYSYQSPILVDFNQNDTFDIVGATHGDDPHFYIRKYDGSFRTGWPVETPNDGWTYSSPSLLQNDESVNVFMSRPVSSFGEMLYGWTPDGELLADFPLSRDAGLEGIISIADVDDDGEMELVFGGNYLLDGFGFIHAYELDGSTPVDGFPIAVRGWTLMNGAAIGDIDGDEQMDLVALSYTLNFGQATDSIYINAFPLGVPYSPDRVAWGTYKGNNSRDGLWGDDGITDTYERPAAISSFHTYPNPAAETISLDVNVLSPTNLSIKLYNAQGKLLQYKTTGPILNGQFNTTLSLNNLPQGVYWISISDGINHPISKPIIKL